MVTIQEPQEEMILLHMNARNIQVSEHSFPVPPVCGTKQNCPGLRDISLQKRVLRDLQRKMILKTPLLNILILTIRINYLLFFFNSLAYTSFRLV